MYNTLDVLKVKILVVCNKYSFLAQTTVQTGDICKLGKSDLSKKNTVGLHVHV